MSHDLNLLTPTKTRITDSTVYGIWEVVQISRNIESSEPIVVTQRMKFQFLEEMLYFRMKDGISKHGQWKLSESNEGRFR